jgi:hypothetical protein
VVVAVITNHQPTEQVVFAAEGERCKSNDMMKVVVVGWYMVETAYDFPLVSVVLFEGESCKMPPVEVPHKVMQKLVETHIFDHVVHSLCIYHQGSFEILNTESEVS